MPQPIEPIRVTTIVCPHVKFDEHGRIDYEALSIFGARAIEIKTIDLDAEHSLCLCPICVDIVQGNLLSSLLRESISSGVSRMGRK